VLAHTNFATPPLARMGIPIVQAEALGLFMESFFYGTPFASSPAGATDQYSLF